MAADPPPPSGARGAARRGRGACVTPLLLRPAAGQEDDDALLTEGRELYATGCSSCHGPDGQGVDAPDGSAARPVARGRRRGGAPTTTCRPGACRWPTPRSSRSARSRPTTTSEIDALVAYVASLGDGPAVPDVDLDRRRPGRGRRALPGELPGLPQRLRRRRRPELRPGGAPACRPATPTAGRPRRCGSGPGQMPVFGPDDPHRRRARRRSPPTSSTSTTPTTPAASPSAAPARSPRGSWPGSSASAPAAAGRWIGTVRSASGEPEPRPTAERPQRARPRTAPTATPPDADARRTRRAGRAARRLLRRDASWPPSALGRRLLAGRPAPGSRACSWPSPSAASASASCCGPSTSCPTRRSTEERDAAGVHRGGRRRLHRRLRGRRVDARAAAACWSPSAGGALRRPRRRRCCSRSARSAPGPGAGLKQTRLTPAAASGSCTEDGDAGPARRPRARRRPHRLPRGPHRRRRRADAADPHRGRPGRSSPAPGREDWTVDGIVAYSKLCTHVGCPVGLYQAEERAAAVPVPPVDLRRARRGPARCSAPPPGRCRSCRSPSTTTATSSPPATSRARRPRLLGPGPMSRR